MPAVCRVGDRDNDDESAGPDIMIEGSPTVFADDGGGSVSPTSPTLSGMVDEPVLRVVTAQESIRNEIAFNIKYPSGISDDMDVNLQTQNVGNPPPKNDPEPTAPEAAVSPPVDCSGTVTGTPNERMSAVLDAVYKEALGGLWKETGSNPNILACFRTVGQNHSSDKGTSNAWCAAFMATMLKRACCKFMKSGLASSYLQYGNQVPVSEGKRGDICVMLSKFSNSGYHVGFYWAPGQSSNFIQVLGGNQHDNVQVNTKVPISQVHSLHRPVNAT